MPEPTYAEFLKQGDLVSKSLEAHRQELAFLADHQARFEIVLTRVRELTVQQASLTVSKQEVSKELAAFVDEGRKLLAFLKAAVRQQFGRRSEKLVAFAQQPFRSKTQPKKTDRNAPPLKPQAGQDEQPDPSSKP